MIEKQFIQKQKKIIESQISRLNKQLEKGKKYADIGSSSDDSALEFEVFEEKLALNKNAEKKLEQLKDALMRIENKKYGYCTKCGDQIEAGRLKTYPEAEFCVTHAE